MKTAAEIANHFTEIRYKSTNRIGGLSDFEFFNLLADDIKAYSEQVATEALRIAAEQATNDLSEYPIIKVNKSSITSVDIKALLK